MNKTFTLNLLLSVLPVLSGIVLAVFFRFDGLEFNGDSFSYYQSAAHLHQFLSNGAYPQPAFWPYGYPFFVSCSFLFFGISVLSAQIVNFISAGITIFIFGKVITLALKYLDYPALKLNFLTLAGCFFLMTSGYFVKYELVTMSDMTGLMWSAASMALIWKWKSSGKKFPLLGAGICFALNVATRYVYGLMIVPMGFILLSDFKRSDLKKHFFNFAIFSSTGLIVFLPQLILILQDSSSSLGHAWLQTWSIRNLYILDRQSVDGHLHPDYPNTLFYAAIPFRLNSFTPLLIPFFLWGVNESIKKLPRWLWSSLIAWLLAFYIFLCGIPIQNARFSLSLFPPILVFILIGVLAGIQTKFKKIIWPIIIVVGCLEIYFSTGFVRQFIDQKNSMRQHSEYFLSQLPANSRIITWDFFQAYYIYHPELDVHTIHDLSPELIPKLFSVKRPTFLIFDEERLEKQWKDYPPYRTYLWIKRHYSCRLLITKEPYKVYEVDLQPNEEPS